MESVRDNLRHQKVFLKHFNILNSGSYEDVVISRSAGRWMHRSLEVIESHNLPL